jgi:hypothetical protein
MIRKEIGVTGPYRKPVQSNLEQQLAVLQKKVLDLEKRIAQLEKNK